MEQDIYLDVYFSFNFGHNWVNICNYSYDYGRHGNISKKYRNISKRYRGRPYKTVKNSFNLCCDSLCYGANCIWKIQCSYNDKKHDYYIHNYLYFKRCCQCILLGKQGRWYKCNKNYFACVVYRTIFSCFG